MLFRGRQAVYIYYNNNEQSKTERYYSMIKIHLIEDKIELVQCLKCKVNK